MEKSIPIQLENIKCVKKKKPSLRRLKQRLRFILEEEAERVAKEKSAREYAVWARFQTPLALAKIRNRVFHSKSEGDFHEEILMMLSFEGFETVMKLKTSPKEIAEYINNIICM